MVVLKWDFWTGLCDDGLLFLAPWGHLIDLNFLVAALWPVFIIPVIKVYLFDSLFWQCYIMILGGLVSKGGFIFFCLVWFPFSTSSWFPLPSLYFKAGRQRYSTFNGTMWCFCPWRGFFIGMCRLGLALLYCARKGSLGLRKKPPQIPWYSTCPKAYCLNNSLVF